jgi:tRNA threonylcarbamoyladenosine biosynthesis protein TsaE
LTGRGLSTTLPRVKTDLPLRFHSTSTDDTLAFGEKLGAHVAALSAEGAIVLLVGPLGAGKTVLAKGIARSLGVPDPLISPTYTIIAEYRTGSVPLYHVDLYRIEGRDQMENLGLEDIFRGKAVVLVEWGEKLPAALLPPLGASVEQGLCMRVTIGMAADGGRDLLVEGIPA